jgi:hypothetical protein
VTQELSEADLVRFSSRIFSKEPMFELCVNEAENCASLEDTGDAAPTHPDGVVA